MVRRSKVSQSQGWYLGWLLAESPAWAADQGPGQSSAWLIRLLHSKGLRSKKECFQDTKAEATDLLRHCLGNYSPPFLPHSVDQKR